MKLMQKIRTIIYQIYRKITKLIFCYFPVTYARLIGVNIGKGCQLVDIPGFGSEPFLINIGDNVSISARVSFVTHDGARWVLDHLFKEDKPFYKFGRIVIGDNCFIGQNATILPNVHIGKNCVIGTNSVVTKNIPEGEVWAGIPAKKISDIKTFKLKFLEHKTEHPIDFDLYWQNKQNEILRWY